MIKSQKIAEDTFVGSGKADTEQDDLNRSRQTE